MFAEAASDRAEAWQTLRLKHAVACPAVKGTSEPLPFVALEHIIAGAGRLVGDHSWEARPAADLVTFMPGDVLFSKLRPYLNKCIQADRPGACPTELLVLRPTPDACDSRFLYHLAQSSPFVSYAVATSYGTKMPRTSWDQLGAAQVRLPPLDEQRGIAGFLDRKTEEIDALIAKKARLMALLEENRTALVTRAITKGLNPDAPTKSSGMERVGDIPEAWSVARLMLLTQPLRPIMYGIVLPGPNVEDGVPLIKGGDVSPERLKLNGVQRTTPEIDANHTRSRVTAGDLVYAIRGSLGMVASVPQELTGSNITQDVARVAPSSQVVADWLRHALASEPIRQSLVTGALGATIKGINIRDLKRAFVPVPPRAEQLAIAEHLEAATSRIVLAVRAVRRSVDRLREYRAALITAAVTGHVDVREG